MAGLILEVVTPEGVLWKKSVAEVSLSTEMGELRILSDHRPMAVKLIPGLLTLQSGGTCESFAIDSGFVYLQRDYLSVITEQAVDVRTIDPTEVTTALEVAEQALREARAKKLDDEAIKVLEARIKYQVVKKMARG